MAILGPYAYLDDEGRTDAELYLTDIADGKIVACNDMRKLADIMLPRFHDEYNGYHYDAERATRPVRWIEKFTCYPEGEKMGKPFILEDYERMAIELSFGFVDEDVIRQFKQVLMMLARKCGKTSVLAAIMQYMLCGDGELGAEVYCCANSEAQARKCFGAADAMRQHSPALSRRLRRGRVQKRGSTGINYDKTGSFIVPLAANAGKLDGLSASAIVYDELAASTDNGALLDVCTESTSARKQPLTWIISTENYVRHNIWDERIEYAEGWLNRTIKDDTFLPILYRLDSYDEVFDEDMWPKASPGLLCGIKSWQYLRDRVNTAKQSPQRMSSLLVKEFCLRANSASTFLTKEECMSNREPFELDPKTDRYCVVAFDLSSKGDLTSATAAWMRPGDEHIYEICQSWIPEEQIRINAAKDFKERDGVPYHLWATKESCGVPMMTIVEGDKIDQRVILDFMRNLVSLGLYPMYVGFDQWHVDDWTLRELKMMVGENNVEPIPQQAKVLSPAMRELQLDLRAGRVRCNANPVLEWARSNLQTKPPDANNNLFPQKKDLKPHNKIDPVMSELFAMITLHKHMDNYLAAIGG